MDHESQIEPWLPHDQRSACWFHKLLAWSQIEYENHTRGETTSATRLSAAPQRPEPLERNARTIRLNFKGAENQQEFSRGRSVSCVSVRQNHIDSYRLLAAHAVGVSSGSLWMDKLA